MRTAKERMLAQTGVYVEGGMLSHIAGRLRMAIEGMTEGQVAAVFRDEPLMVNYVPADWLAPAAPRAPGVPEKIVRFFEKGELEPETIRDTYDLLDQCAAILNRYATTDMLGPVEFELDDGTRMRASVSVILDPVLE